MSEAEREVIRLGGREFQVIDWDARTVLQDHYLSKLVRQTGVDKVMPMEGESDAVYLIRLQTVLIDSGKATELIAGFLLPVGKTERDWTPEMAREVARHIAGCHTEADRDRVIDLSMQAVMGFFRRGLERLGRSAPFIAASPETASGAPVSLH